MLRSGHRAYLQRPALGTDDVYVARVLRWCRQFYPQRAEDGIRNGMTPEPVASALDLWRADAAAEGRSPLETTIDEAPPWPNQLIGCECRS